MRKLKLGHQMREVPISNTDGSFHTRSRLLAVVRRLLSAAGIEAADIELLKGEDVVDVKLPASTLKLALWAEAAATEEDEE
jgi:hypothetical protein